MVKKKETHKKHREFRVLAAAAVVSAITVAGSTFAWLTSKDEVTNRLIVKSSYRTAIYETDFKPPDNWEVGQTVDKNVSIVNSGNIDAIVKVSIGGTASMTYWEGVPTNNVPNPTEYRQLNMSEVIAIEAGGRLVTTTVENQSYSNCSTASPYKFEINNTENPTTGSFTEAGYYIFKRTDAENTTNKPTYSGYYCDGSNNYYALYTEVVNNASTDGTTVISLVLDNVSENATTHKIENYKLMKKQTAPEKVKLEYDYTQVNNKKITVNLKKNNEENDEILATFEIALANIGKGASQWTYIDGKGFYYNDDLESESASDKTSKLIDSVRFVRANAYFENLVYDLNISHESVQVVIGDDNKECLPGVDADNTTVKPFNDGVSATAENSDNEITRITWTKETTTP